MSFTLLEDIQQKAFQQFTIIPQRPYVAWMIQQGQKFYDRSSRGQHALPIYTSKSSIEICIVSLAS